MDILYRMRYNQNKCLIHISFCFMINSVPTDDLITAREKNLDADENPNY